MAFSQTMDEVRCEWGESGIAAVAPGCEAIVIVDVLSFSTCVDVATGRGAMVYPLADDHSAAELAARVGAHLAGRREETGYSLSPASLMAIPAGERLVLPSPNGSRLTAMAAAVAPEALILAGCLRNARAVAAAATQAGSRVAVIAAGERWRSDWTLRPALEDWLGAGAIISHLAGRRSPEAEAAAAVFAGLRRDLASFMRACSSGRELIELGFANDVTLAAQLDCNNRAPALCDGAYVQLS